MYDQHDRPIALILSNLVIIIIIISIYCKSSTSTNETKSTCTHRVEPCAKDGAAIWRMQKKLTTTTFYVFARRQHRLPYLAMVNNPSILSQIQMLIRITSEI